jgi:hypothetical protein
MIHGVAFGEEWKSIVPHLGEPRRSRWPESDFITSGHFPRPRDALESVDAEL